MLPMFHLLLLLSMTGCLDCSLDPETQTCTPLLGNTSKKVKLAKDGLARGISKLKFKKYHLCLACALGKSKKSSHQPKAKDTNQEKLYLLHIDLCADIMEQNLSIRPFENFMKVSASRIKHLLLALLNRTALSKDETITLSGKA
ncbi:hypothetical protein Tco_1199589 [Tanacetum coccineum]